MYEDRLDGRIDAATYDQKVAQIRLQQGQIQHRIGAREAARLRPVSQGMNLRELVGRMTQSFVEQTASEQRKLLQVLVQKAFWKNDALHITLREPFEALRVDNRAVTQCAEPIRSEGAPRTTINVTESRAPES
jgi:hypothetical protein